ncbi:hypothetical protein [Methanoregula sp.]|uniref:hypothetical protein n=1 Tax=Methanoregula sp. TaxID=2052170 RepID=UPI003565B483
MGWLGNLLKTVAGSQPTELIFVPSIPAPDKPDIGKEIQPDACYIELYLESLRLTRARRFATRFHAVAYSFVTLSREGEARSQLAAVSKPDKLAELDASSLDRVITISKQMMGATPFRGGPVSVEFGLFSVKSGNLLTPVLDYITRVSSVAGISYVGTIKPFLPLITEGMDLIAGQQQDTALEVGVDTDLALTTSCVAAVLALPKGSIDVKKLSLDSDSRLLLDGKPLECGYAVFSLRRSLEKWDYGEIPDLKVGYAAIQTAIKENRITDAKEALAAFRRTAITSADLIPSDAERLVEKAKKKVEDAFPSQGLVAKSARKKPVEKLSDIGLYD